MTKLVYRTSSWESGKGFVWKHESVCLSLHKSGGTINLTATNAVELSFRDIFIMALAAIWFKITNKASWIL